MSKFNRTDSCKVAHLTSVHPRSDSRIFFKQCRSLATNGYEVTFVVADGLGDAHQEGVKVIDVSKLTGRLNRIFKTTQRVLEMAIKLDADIYHLHDPELIPIGLKLKHRGKKVIFDAHEDFPKQLLGKSYLNPLFARLLSRAVSIWEQYACKQFDGIIAATPFIRDKFLCINSNTLDINNFPILDELEANLPWDNKLDEFCYVGGIGAIRGIREILCACNLLQTPARLNLAGRFYEPNIETEMKKQPGWKRVNDFGYLDRTGVRTVLERSVIGLVTLHPIINYLDALPVKMFEYMAAGIPVIASNFPLWSKIVEGNKCGVCVNPLDPKEIASKIDQLMSDRDWAKHLGENGRRAVVNYYNWSIEETKLIKFYQHIIDR